MCEVLRFYASEPRPPERALWWCWLFDHKWDWSHVRGDVGEAGTDTCLRCGAQRPNYTLPCRCLSVWVFTHHVGRPSMWGGVDCHKALCQCESNGFAGVEDAA